MEKVESEEDINPRNLALIQKWIQLDIIWKSQQNSRPPRPRPRTCSTASSSTTTAAAAATVTSSLDHRLLIQSSPRTLMSSLQHRIPHCSDAVEEILMDRRAAIMSGRFKGRQLFAAEEEEEEEESSLTHSYSGGYGDACIDWLEEREVEVNYDGCEEKYELSSSNFAESCPLPVVETAEKRDGDEKRGRRTVATAGFGAVLIVLAFVFCFLSCYGNNVEELILVPT